MVRLPDPRTGRIHRRARQRAHRRDADPALRRSVAAIRAETGLEPELSTGGGTSDGRFIAPTGAQVIEFGPLNATIHKIDECVSVGDLDRLSQIYEGILVRLLG